MQTPNLSSTSCFSLLDFLLFTVFDSKFVFLKAMSQEYAVTHKSGRVFAYRLLCRMMMNRHGLECEDAIIVHFFRLLRLGLTSTDQVRRHFLCTNSTLGLAAAKPFQD